MTTPSKGSVKIHGPPFHCPVCFYLWDTATAYEDHIFPCRQHKRSKFDDIATFYDGNDKIAPKGRCDVRRISGNLIGRLCLRRIPCRCHDPSLLPQILPYPKPQQPITRIKSSCNIPKFSITPAESSSAIKPFITPISPPHFV